MKLVNKYAIYCVLSSVIFCGCGGNSSSENSSSGKSSSEMLLEAIATYRTSDVKTAEEAMLNMERKINERIEANTENDEIMSPDAMLAGVHSRLFLIYEYLGDTNKAAIAYQNAAKHNTVAFNLIEEELEAKKAASDDPMMNKFELGELTDELLEKAIRGIDKFSGAPVWRTGANPTQSSETPIPAKTEDEASCLANMYQLGIGVRVYMNDNEDQYPNEIKDMEFDLETSQLMCPLAPNYAKRDSFTWENLTVDDVSYNYLGKGLTDATGPDTVIWRCRYHDHTVRADGKIVSD